jgi:hypothetical protein
MISALRMVKGGESRVKGGNSLPLMPPGMNLPVPTTVQGMADLLTANRPFRIWQAVRNNYTAIEGNIEGASGLSPVDLYSLLLSMDSDEANAALNVGYLTGSANVHDQLVDQAFAMATEAISTASLGENAEKMLPLLGGLAAVFTVFGTIHNGKVAADAAEAAQQQQMLADLQAERDAAAKTAAMQAWWKKNWPWVAGASFLLILLILHIARK